MHSYNHNDSNNNNNNNQTTIRQQSDNNNQTTIRQQQQLQQQGITVCRDLCVFAIPFFRAPFPCLKVDTWFSE